MPTKKTQDLNMTREYRAELKTLRKNRRKVLSDDRRAVTDLGRKVRCLHRERVRGRKAVVKVINTIDRRIAILEGRLS